MSNKCFIYQNKLYEFNFEHACHFSHYFSRKQKEFETLKIINLVDETDFSPKILSTSINAFINYFSDKKIIIDLTNIIDLQFLSQKYEVQELTQQTNEYIENNHKDIISTFFSRKDLFNEKDSYEYENIISDYLPEFVCTEEEGLLSLPISQIHRILFKYSEKRNNNKKVEEDEKVGSFLTKVINKHGFEISNLFTKLGFINENEACKNSFFMAFLNHVDNDSMNTKMMKFLYESIIEMKEKIKEQSKEIEELKKQTKNNKFIIRGGISSVTIPPGITTIKEEVFSNYPQISKITIPDSVVNIESHAFNGCQNLTKISIPKSVKKIKSNTFVGCENLREIEIPQTVNEIEENAIQNCDKLKIVKIDPYSTRFPNNLLDDCSSLKFLSIIDEHNIFLTSKMTENLVIGDDIRTIQKKLSDLKKLFGSYNYLHCEITYPSQMFDDIYQKIMELKKDYGGLNICIFYTGMSSTDMKFKFNNEIKYIIFDTCIQQINGQNNDGPFERCSSISKVIIPFSVKSIGMNAFAGCTSLKLVKIESDETEISPNSFPQTTQIVKGAIPNIKTKMNWPFFMGFGLPRK